VFHADCASIAVDAMTPIALDHRSHYFFIDLGCARDDNKKDLIFASNHSRMIATNKTYDEGIVMTFAFLF